MTEHLPENLQTKITERLAFYQDLGINLFYRDRTAGSLQPSLARSTGSPLAREGEPLPKLTPNSEKREAFVGAQHASPQLGILPIVDKTVFVPPIKTSTFFEMLERVENDTLLKIREDIGDCTRCRLHKARHHIVFADGNPQADLVFVGEGPGADEDATGVPFVGRAGKLLTQMIQAMGLQREDVYICNVVKCRPPENRQPLPDEVTTCSPFLVRQLEVVNPKVIVCLGATAAQTLLETTQGISKFRGQWLDFRGRKLLATYHPAYLLRNPAAKGEVWKDLQKVMTELGLAVKKAKSV